MTQKHKPRDRYGEKKLHRRQRTRRTIPRHTTRFDLELPPEINQEPAPRSGYSRHIRRQKLRAKQRTIREQERIHPQPPGTFRRVTMKDGTVYEDRPDGRRKVGFKA